MAIANNERHEDDPVIRRLGERVVRVDDRSLSPILSSGFPFLVGRLDWTKVPDASFRPAPPERKHGANLGPESLDTRSYAQQVSAFFNECMLKIGASDSWVAYVGDNTEPEYKVRLDSVGELMDEVSDVPEHKYIFALDASWCFMWDFEDELYFGRRPSSGKRIGRP